MYFLLVVLIFINVRLMMFLYNFQLSIIDEKSTVNQYLSKDFS
jgi:hypothetical protein